MKRLIVILLIVFANVGLAQNINLKTCTVKQEKSPIEKIVIMELAVAGYGLIDYTLYNAWGKKGNMEYYRFTQGIIFTAINYVLAKIAPETALGFTISVWGGMPDSWYYGADKLFGHKGGFSEGNEFAINKYYSHLNFMPTVIGQPTVHGVDLIVNNILATGVSVVLQYSDLKKMLNF